jgi:prefoldin subunit 1
MLWNQLLQEVESQAIQSQQQINIVKSQINVKQRDARLNQLTSTELSQLSRDTKVYEGLGKMSVTATIWGDQFLDHLTDVVSRFVATPISNIDSRLLKESQTLKSEIAALEKRLHYLETTHKNSRDHIEKILQTGGRS